MTKLMMTTNSDRVVYTRHALVALRGTAKLGIKHPIPTKLRKPFLGYRARAKRKAKLTTQTMRYKPSSPSIVMGNVNSPSNKCDEQVGA